MSAVALPTPIKTEPAAPAPTPSDTLPRASLSKALRLGAGAVLIIVGATLLIAGLDGLNLPARTALAVFATTLIARTVMDLPDTPVALSGAPAMVLGGAVGEEALFAAMGNQLIWLLIAAFVIAGVLRQTGITEHWPLLRWSVSPLYRGCSGPAASPSRPLPSPFPRPQPAPPCWCRFFWASPRRSTGPRSAAPRRCCSLRPFCYRPAPP
ncbi:hypothetical protein N8D56_01805 [Devosia sp. A8/3-2]|nr:hypothetical protein N8D56_01805 [Devosia sp. A8/3-2]